MLPYIGAPIIHFDRRSEYNRAMLIRFLRNLFGTRKRDDTPERAAAILESASAKFASGELGEAARLLELAANLGEQGPAAQLLRGQLRLVERRYRDAAVCFERGLAQAPSSPVVALRLQLGVELAALEGRYDSGQAAPPPAMDHSSTSVSLVICSINPAKFERVVSGYRAAFAGMPLEVVGIHDAKSLCEGYNRGLARSRGDVVMFSHDDVEILGADFGARLLGHMSRFDLVGVAGTSRLISPAWNFCGQPKVHGMIAHQIAGSAYFQLNFYGGPVPCASGIQALDGVFFAARREIFDTLRFDEETFDGWHFYDIDFSYAAHLNGFRVGACSDLLLLHASSGESNPGWERYGSRFKEKYADRLPDTVERRGPVNTYFALAEGREELVALSGFLLRRFAAAGPPA